MGCSLLSPSLSWAGLHDTKYDHLFMVYGNAYLPQYDWRWIKAQSYQESRYNPAAVSPAGAIGLMQIMPGTGREQAIRTGIKGPLTSPTISVIYGVDYDRRMALIWRFPRTPMELLELVFASYNAGAGHIIEAQKLAGGHLQWEGISPMLGFVTGRHAEETIQYVARIKRWYYSLVEEEVK